MNASGAIDVFFYLSGGLFGESSHTLGAADSKHFLTSLLTNMTSKTIHSFAQPDLTFSIR